MIPNPKQEKHHIYNNLRLFHWVHSTWLFHKISFQLKSKHEHYEIKCPLDP